MQCMYRSQVHAAQQAPMQAVCLLRLLMLSPEALHLHAPLQLQADTLLCPWLISPSMR